MVGGDLTLNMDSYSCPFDAICATVGDYMGYPAQYPEMHVYEAGEYIDTVFSSMHGYIEMDSLWSSNYDVDIAAFQIFISETGWVRGYHHTSAESLTPVTISAYDKFGDPTITGDIFLGNGNTGAWLGWIYSPPSFTVYATPGTAQKDPDLMQGFLLQYCAVPLQHLPQKTPSSSHRFPGL